MKLLIIMTTVLFAADEFELVQITSHYSSDIHESAPNDDQSTDDCCICLVQMDSGSDVIQIPCKHSFHKKCLDGWTANHTTCPMCRGNVPENKRKKISKFKKFMKILEESFNTPIASPFMGGYYYGL